MSPWLLILLTSVLSAGLTLAVAFAVYRWRIKPRVDAGIEQLNRQVADLERRVANGVRQGITEALRDLPDKAVRSTTQSVMRIGVDLVEGGLGGILSDRSRRRDERRD